jgi:hypothetical protein
MSLIASLAMGTWTGPAFAGSLAARVTVNFDSFGYADYGDLGSKVITDQGFTITASDFNWETFTSGTGFCNNSSAGCVAMADTPAHAETITIQAVNGDRFKFTSFWIGNHGAGGGVAKVEGFRNGSPTPVATLNSGFPANGDVSPVNAVITLPTSFQDVDKVVITSNSVVGFYDVFDDFVFDPPVRVPILSTSAATGITTTAATLNGTADDNTATSTISFDYGTTTAYGTNVAATTGGTVTAGTGATAAAVNISGLTCATTYHFRITGTNSFGTANSPDATFTTAGCPQTITFAQPATQSFGSTPTLTATATSGLTVAFTSATTGVCTITSGGALTFVTTGTCTINANQAGNASFAAAPQVQRSFTVAAVVPGAPTIGTATAGNAQASVTFTAPAFTGGAAITSYTVTANPGGATGTGAASPIVVTGLTNGTSYTFTVTATNSVGTGSASSASNSATPIASQTITFAQPATQSFGSTPTLTATATSGLTVAFTSATTGVCTITSGGALTFVTTGTCTINADQAGNGAFSAAPQVQRSFTVAAVLPGAPTIGTATAGNAQASVTFTAPAFTGGAAITSYTVTANPGGATGTGAASPIVVTGLTNGSSYTFTVTATNSAGTGSASSASNSATPIASQTISFVNPGTQSFGTTPTLTATATSGLTVAFTSATTGVCTITSGGALTFVTTGTCTINADQAGNGAFSAAPQVQRSFTVAAVVPGAPTIGTATAGNAQASVTFTAPAFTGGAAITSYTVTANPGGATGTGAASPIVVTGLTNGTSYTFTVTATNSAGTGAASAASNAVTPITGQTITFAQPATQSFGTTPTLTATATSGLTVTFTSATASVCTITSGGALTFVTTGTCTINADQAGNGAFTAAPQVQRSFTVAAVVPGAPTIGTATAGSNQASVAFTAPASNGGAAITSYTVTATPGGATATGAASPIAVTGLANGTSYTFTVKATNSVGTGANSAASNAVIPFASTPQTITFGPVGTVRISSPTVNLVVSASSGLPVTLASSTPTVCSVSGTVVTALTVGTCTIQATQSGSTNFASASQSLSFDVLPGVPDAPKLSACTGGNHTAVCTFTPAAANGAPAATSFTLSCQLGSATPLQVSGAASPLTVIGLTNGQIYQCSVSATNVNGKSVDSNAVSAAPFSKLATGAGVDINGDGKAEILLRAAGTSSIATLNANNRLDFKPVNSPGPEWRVLGTGDFRGTHRSDLLIQNIATGAVHIWFNFEGPLDTNFFVRTVKPNWTVEAVTDLDGDGKSDIVWRYINPVPGDNDSGVVFVWFMDGATILDIKSRGGAPATWNLVGATDLDGDGKADLIWESPTGQARALVGTEQRSFVNKVLGNAPTGYNQLKATDFDGDGFGDLLFRSAAGKVKLWRMNGTTVLAEIDLPDTDPTWTFYAATDLNGDGTSDIVWKKADGTLVLWLMSATSPGSPTIVDPAGTAPTGYNVVE